MSLTIEIPRNQIFSMSDPIYKQTPKGVLVKVGEDQYISLAGLNEQDLADVKEIKELERLARNREK